MEEDWEWRCYLDVETLHCPICTEPLSPPVYQCENGHTICSVCCENIISKGYPPCPSCYQPTGRIRCLAVEKILESVQVPCKHARYGCKEMLQYSKRVERDEHERQTCNYQPFPCPLPSCKHEGPFSAFPSHLVEVHGVRRTELERDGVRRCVKFRMTAVDYFVMVELDDDGLILVHREDKYSLGDAFFCTAYGASEVYKLKVKRKAGRSSFYKMMASAHDSSRQFVQESSVFVESLLIPVADASLPREFDVKVSIAY